MARKKATFSTEKGRPKGTTSKTKKSDDIISDSESIQDQWLPEFKLEDILFKQQLAFVKDPNPFRTAVCSRRAGKTVACAADLIDVCLKNLEAVCCYATLTRGMAKRIVWPELRRLNREYGLQADENNTELTMTFPNGSVIELVGAGTLDQIDKFRGRALRRVYIDEAQGFRSHLKEMCDDVFGPSLIDYAGHLIMIGTPAAVPTGYFYECAEKNPDWGHHKWTFFDNPFIAKKSKTTHMELLNRELKRRGVSIDDPSIKREYFGLWEKDDKALLLHFDKIRNYSEILERRPEHFHIVGVRISTDNTTSIAVLAYSADSPITYLVEETVPRDQTLDGLDTEMRRIMKDFNVVRLAIDSDGTGRDLAEAIKLRYGLPFEESSPSEKLGNYRLLDNSLRNGTFKAHFKSQFAEDCNLIERDAYHSVPGRIAISGHSDMVDAVLIAFRKSPAYAYIKPEEKKVEVEVDWEYQYKRNKELREKENEISWDTDKQGIPDWLKWGE